MFVSNLSAVGMVDNVTEGSDKILSTAEHDRGISYYFRGNPIYNYVEFAGMCWRIVRVQGDGSVKLILASEKTCSITNLTTDSGYATDGEVGTQGTILNAHYGYKMINNYSINDYKNSIEDNTNSAKVKLNEWFDRKIINEKDKSLLKNDIWCIGNLTNAYDDTGKIIGVANELINSGSNFNFIAGNEYSVTKTPSYHCEKTSIDGEIDINKVGMLTFDEVVYAGGGNK